MTLFAENRASDLGLERNGVMFAAMIANNFKSLWCVGAYSGFFRTTAQTALRRHHVPLIEYFLLFFCEQKGLFALHTWNFYIGHIFTSHVGQTSVYGRSLSQHASAA